MVPVDTRDSQVSVDGSVLWINRTRAVGILTIDFHNQGAQTSLTSECVNNFESPEDVFRMDKKQLMGSREIACVSS